MSFNDALFQLGMDLDHGSSTAQTEDHSCAEFNAQVADPETSPIVEQSVSTAGTTIFIDLHAATGDAIEVETLELEAQGLTTLRRALGRLDVVEAFGAVKIKLKLNKQNAESKFLSCVLCLPFHVILLDMMYSCFLNECAVINTKPRH